MMLSLKYQLKTGHLNKHYSFFSQPVNKTIIVGGS